MGCQRSEKNPRNGRFPRDSRSPGLFIHWLWHTYQASNQLRGKTLGFGRVFRSFFMDRDWVGLFFTGWRHQLLTGLERGRPFDGPVVGSEAPLPATGHRPPPALPQEQHCREGAREEQNPIKKSVSAQSDPTD